MFNYSVNAEGMYGIISNILATEMFYFPCVRNNLNYEHYLLINTNIYCCEIR